MSHNYAIPHPVETKEVVRNEETSEGQCYNINPESYRPLFSPCNYESLKYTIQNFLELSGIRFPPAFLFLSVLNICPFSGLLLIAPRVIPRPFQRRKKRRLVNLFAFLLQDFAFAFYALVEDAGELDLAEVVLLLAS